MPVSYVPPLAGDGRWDPRPDPPLQSFRKAAECKSRTDWVNRHKIFH